MAIVVIATDEAIDGEVEGRAEERPAADPGVDDERHREAERHLERHDCDRVEQRVLDRPPEDLVVDELAVVVQPPLLDCFPRIPQLKKLM